MNDTVSLLMRRLEIKTLSEITDYDVFCNLMEYEEGIDESEFFDLLGQADPLQLSLVVGKYLDEIKDLIPSNGIGLYKKINEGKKVFQNLFHCDPKRGISPRLLDVLYRFRQWYATDAKLSCHDLGKDETRFVTLCEALLLIRMERLGEGLYEIDFDETMAFDFDADRYAAEEFGEDYDDENPWDRQEKNDEREEEEPGEEQDYDAGSGWEERDYDSREDSRYDDDDEGYNENIDLGSCESGEF